MYIRLMAETEFDRLTLRLVELIERRAALRAFLEQASGKALTDGERQDIQTVLGVLDEEMSELERRLESLRGGTGAGGTG